MQNWPKNLSVFLKWATMRQPTERRFLSLILLIEYIDYYRNICSLTKMGRTTRVNG